MMYCRFQDYSRVPVRSKDLWMSVARMHDLKQRSLDQWNEAGVDVVVCPVFACPATTLDAANKYV